ncbi:MAG: hypothetical protein HC895_24295 [Leptolyngbyaceae cyanobacterium SM1_3_5]|nr:hypothetical protein [Leptolyngbyaceae cyanobacterium SM1_3_5]
MAEFQPGNPKGWGDPLPLVYVLVGVILVSSLVDRLGLASDLQAPCPPVNGTAQQ